MNEGIEIQNQYSITLKQIDQIEFLKLLNDLERELIFPGTLSYKYISTCELIYDKID